jgi:hypothetical protein
LRRHIGFFLVTYRHLAPAIAGPAESFVCETLQYAGIFLLHRMLVGLEFAGTMDASGSLMLALGRSLLRDPALAAETLIGAPLT